MKQLLQFYKAQFILRKLKRLGYFELTPNEKLNHSQEIVLRHLKRGRRIIKLWGFEEELEFDYRSFIIQESSKDDGIEMDWKKWDEVLELIGLKFKIGKNFETANNQEHQEVNINGNKYLIIKDYNDEDVTKKSFMKFSEIVNKELSKINSNERTQLYGENPTRLVILNEELKNAIF